MGKAFRRIDPLITETKVALKQSVLAGFRVKPTYFEAFFRCFFPKIIIFSDFKEDI
jgi:hypothetical protein